VCKKNRGVGLILMMIALAVFVTFLLPEWVIILMLCMLLLLAGFLLFR